MMNNHGPERELTHGLIRNRLQLVRRHHFMRLIIDSFDFPSIFKLANGSPEIDDCARREIGIQLGRFQARLGQ